MLQNIFLSSLRTYLFLFALQWKGKTLADLIDFSVTELNCLPFNLHVIICNSKVVEHSEPISNLSELWQYFHFSSPSQVS